MDGVIVRRGLYYAVLPPERIRSKLGTLHGRGEIISIYTTRNRGHRHVLSRVHNWRG